MNKFHGIYTEFVPKSDLDAQMSIFFLQFDAQ